MLTWDGLTLNGECLSEVVGVDRASGRDSAVATAFRRGSAMFSVELKGGRRASEQLRAIMRKLRRLGRASTPWRSRLVPTLSVRRRPPRMRVVFRRRWYWYVGVKIVSPPVDSL